MESVYPKPIGAVAVGILSLEKLHRLRENQKKDKNAFFISWKEWMR